MRVTIYGSFRCPLPVWRKLPGETGRAHYIESGFSGSDALEPLNNSLAQLFQLSFLAIVTTCPTISASLRLRSRSGRWKCSEYG